MLCRILVKNKFRSRTERVLRTTYVVMYAFRSKTELVPVFQSTGTQVPFGIPAESGRNLPPRHRRGGGKRNIIAVIVVGGELC